jgi:RNA polymerase sigma factor (sigma-70 family)
VFREESDSDYRLVALARAGDVQAFERLHERYRPDLLAFCRHLTGQREDAEDAVQYTFFVTYREIVETTRPLDLRPWLFTVARNRCSSLLRRRLARPTVNGPKGVEAHAEPPTDEIERREELRHLIRDLQGLPELQREALLLAEIADLRHAEIAPIIGVSAAKVKALVFQARRSLTSAREARDADCGDIRAQLSTLSGGALRRRRLRRHLRECDACSAFEQALAERRKGIAARVPPAAGAAGGLLGIGSGGAAKAAIAIVAVAGSGVALSGLSSPPADRRSEAPPVERVEQRAAAGDRPSVRRAKSRAPSPAAAVGLDRAAARRTSRDEASPRRVRRGAAEPQDGEGRIVPPPELEVAEIALPADRPARADQGAPPTGNTEQGPAAGPPGHLRQAEEALPPGQARREAGAPAPGQARKQGAEPPGQTGEKPPTGRNDEVAPPTAGVPPPAADNVPQALPPQANGNGWGAGGKKPPKPGT